MTITRIVGSAISGGRSMTYPQPYDELTVGGRPAVFMWFAFNNRNYVRVRFTDTQERKTVSVLDIDASPDISALALRCIELVRAKFAELDIEGAQR